MVFNLIIAVLGVISIAAVVTGFEEGGIAGGTSIAFGVLSFLGILWLVRPEHRNKASVFTLLGIMVALSLIMPIIVILARDKNTILNIERETVQTAMYSMMADRNLTAVDDHSTGPAVNTWTAFLGSGAIPLSDYLRENTTLYYYCWNAQGRTWPRNDPGKDPTRKSAEKAGECSALP